MKKIFIAAAALSAIIFVSACGAGINLSGVEETRAHAVADNYAHQSHNAQKARNTEINALDDDTGCRSEQT